MMNGQALRAQDIVAVALACYRMPAMHGDVLRGDGAIPEDIAVLMKLAGGSSPQEVGLGSPNERDTQDIVAAARFYIEQTLFRREAGHYRLLGVARDASEALIKEHYRLLMRMLHPDRLPDSGGWTDGYATRVNQAYEILRNPEARVDYDTQLDYAERAAQIPSSSAGPVAAVVRAGANAYPRDARRTQHRTPLFIMLGVAAVAALYVGDVYISSRTDKLTSPASSKQPDAHEPSGLVASPSGVDLNQLPPQARERLQALIETGTNLPNQRQTGDTVHVAASGEVGASKPGRTASDLADRAGNAHDKLLSAQGAEVRPAMPPPPTPPIPPSFRLASDMKQAPMPDTTGMVVAPTPPVVSNTAQNAKTAEPAATQGSSLPEDPSHLAAADIDRLFARYVFYYERGDITGFMSLFDDSARSASGDKSKIRQDYENFFQSTQFRHLELNPPNWRGGSDAFVGKVPFKATVKAANDAQAKVYTGALYFEVAKRRGGAMITALFYSFT